MDRIGYTQALYCAVADVVNLPWPAFGSLSETAQAELIAAASEKIDEHCRRPFGFASQLITEVFNGKNTTKLWLSTRPVISIATVTVNGYALDNTLGDAWTVEPYKGYLVRGNGQDDNRFVPWWPAGCQNIQVQYYAGYDTIPQRIVRATAMAVKWMYESDPATRVYTSERIGDYSYNVNSPAAGQDLPPHIAARLVGFVQDDAFA